MKKINIKKTLVNKQNIIIAVLVTVVFSVLTVGFAAYDQLLSIGGNVNVVKAGTIEITNITLLDGSNLNNPIQPIFETRNSNFNITFNGTEPEYYALYQIEITNNSLEDYVYSGNNIEKNITSSVLGDTADAEIIIEDITNGDVIRAGEIKNIKFRIVINNPNSSATYNVTIDNNFNFTTDSSGNLLASIPTSTIDLTGKKTAQVTVNVINTYSYDRDFYLSQNNNNLILNNNQNIKYTISANSTQSFTFTLKQADDSIFLNGTETTSITMSSNNINNVNIENLEILVDIYVEPDTEIPTVGNASLSILDPDGEVMANWDRIDSEGTPIVNYNILLYNSSNELVKEVNTRSDATSYKFTNIPEESYYIIISGEDEAGNKGTSYMSTATTANGYATKSSTVKLRWVFTVTYTLSSMTTTGENIAYLNQAYNTTFTASNGYTLPSTVTVTMNGVTLSNNTDYTYSSSNKTLKINKVTGNITIRGTATRNTCLVENTKILLANNTYKNIQDIEYNDLLKAYSYEEGRFVNVYPIWIEKKNKASKYHITEFSDGTILKTVGFHGVNNLDKNSFVSVDDKDNFKIGDSIAIFDENSNNFKQVKVKKIIEKDEEVNYYHIVSTRYYNVIANNILTTDGTTILSNLYGFNNNITWPSIRNAIMSNQNNLYRYDEFSDIMPYYMFKGLRVEEGKILSNYGLTKDIFKSYLQGNQLNNEIMKQPIKSNNGNRMWMVTTSDDIVINKDYYLIKEGDNYLIKEPINKIKFKAWYNTGDGKYYNPGEKIKIWYGTYLEAIYE